MAAKVDIISEYAREFMPGQIGNLGDRVIVAGSFILRMAVSSKWRDFRDKVFSQGNLSSKRACFEDKAGVWGVCPQKGLVLRTKAGVREICPQDGGVLRTNGHREEVYPQKGLVLRTIRRKAASLYLWSKERRGPSTERQ